MTDRANEALAVPSKGDLHNAVPAALQRKCACAEQGESCARCSGEGMAGGAAQAHAQTPAQTRAQTPAQAAAQSRQSRGADAPPPISWFQVLGQTLYVEGLPVATIRTDDGVNAKAQGAPGGGKHLSVNGPLPSAFALNEAGIAELRKRGFQVNTFDWGERGFTITVDWFAEQPPARHAKAQQPGTRHPNPQRATGQPTARAPATAAAPTQRAPEPAPEPLLAHKSGKQLIDEHTGGLNLDEDKLGANLLAYAKQGSLGTVDGVLNELSDSDRDDVAAAFVNAATDEQLEAIARTDAGRKLFLRLYDDLTSGYMTEGEAAAAERLMSARTQRIDPKHFIEAPDKATVIPFSGIGWTKFSSASLSVHRTEDGKIRVRSYMKAEHFEKAKHLPGGLAPILIGDGVVMDPDTVVGLYNYDEGEKITYVPAIYLLQLGNMETTKAYSMMGEAGVTGLTLGWGGAAVGGARATTGAAMSRGAVWAARGVTALKWADRGAMAIGVASTVINDHRGLILKHGGETGAQLLKHWATVERIVGAYGLVRGGLALGQTAVALRSTLKQWRATRAALKGLSAEEAAALDGAVLHAEKSLEEIEAAQRTSVRKMVPSGMSDETADMLARKPELLDSLAKNPRAARALTLCKSPCIPEFAEPSQVARLERLLAKAEAEQIQLDTDLLREYLHKTESPVDLNEALDVLEWRMHDKKLASAHGPIDAILDEADVVAQPGMRTKGAKPPDVRLQEAKHGNKFNEAQNEHYPHSEVPMYDKAGKLRRLDAYREPGSPGAFPEGEIVSRKSLVTGNGQIVHMDPDTMLDYFQEFQLKYPNNKAVANVPSAKDLAGKTIQGRYVMEIPPQDWDQLPDRVLRDAAKSHVTIRDTNGKVYFDGGGPRTK